MPKTIQFKLDFDQNLEKHFKQAYPEYRQFRILSKSLDARGAPRGKKPVYHYILEVIKEGESFSAFEEKIGSKGFSQGKSFAKKPVFVGAGPASLFGALRMVEQGIPSIIIERGDVAQKRMLHISKHWRRGEFNPESNVCFGEGGAGLFSDGKLITRVKSPFVKYVMNKFVEFGAPAETAYISNPHLGSNKIRALITKISSFLKENGCEFYYNTRVDRLIYEDQKVAGVELSSGEKIYSSHVILAAGHSAKEMYWHLKENNVALEAKNFAIGVRIEHPRQVIDELQHGKFAPKLEAARYKLSYHERKSEKGTYSFCMCPGGYVLSSGTDPDGIVVNGMSNFARNSPWSNSALVVGVQAGEDFSKEDVLAGLKFQEDIEKKAWELSKKFATGKELPAQTVEEFLSGKLNENPLPKTSCPSKVFKADLRKIFPKFIIEHLKTGLMDFDRKLKGFAFGKALLIAPETRTSAPVTILRDKKTLMSLSHQGLYPCGEGAGYAGGITSAAVDGIKVAESIMGSV
ncbi:MAG: NAD(P)/FAD-dependent oxidoreductase [Bacteriovoracaceae bacterium]